MSSIKAFECLTGHISGLCTLSGKLTCFGSLSGKLSAVIDFNAYSGEYEVVPNAFNTQVLPTANKVLKKDIVVQKVYRFNCPNCQSRLEADSSELTDIGGKVSKFYCPVCRKDRYITWSDLRKKIVYEGSQE